MTKTKIKAGYKDEYLVIKGDGNPSDPEAWFWVARIDTGGDPRALEAFRHYACGISEIDPQASLEMLMVYRLIKMGYAKKSIEDMMRNFSYDIERLDERMGGEGKK